MSLYAVDKLPDDTPKGEIHLQNPMNEDFSMVYLDPKNQATEIKIPALETCKFPHAIGIIVRNHLANFVLNKNGFSYKTDVSIELAKIRDEVTIYE